MNDEFPWIKPPAGTTVPDDIPFDANGWSRGGDISGTGSGFANTEFYTIYSGYLYIPLKPMSGDDRQACVARDRRGAVRGADRRHRRVRGWAERRRLEQRPPIRASWRTSTASARPTSWHSATTACSTRWGKANAGVLVAPSNDFFTF